MIHSNSFTGNAGPPPPEILSCLMEPIYTSLIYYLDGSPLDDEDLGRASAGSADGIFILSDKFCQNPDEEDAKTILLHASIRRYIHTCPTEELEGDSTDEKTDPKFFMQLLRPENRRHISVQDPFGDKELLVCLYEIKMGMLAKACMFPGTSTLLINLLTSFSDDPFGTEDALSAEKSSMDEYRRGCD